MTALLQRSDLDPYQVDAVELLKSRMLSGAFLRMGMGKTVITLTAMSDLLDDYAVNKWLIAAPLRVANLVWAQEAQKWAHLQHLKMSICTGTAEDKIAGFRTKADIHITNREFVYDLVTQYRWKWGGLVLDESSGYKNPKSNRWRAIREVRDGLDSLIELSGTPAPNGLIDLWAQVYLLDKGKRLGRTIGTYRNRYFDKNPSGFGYTPKAGAFDEIMAAVADICFTSDHKIEGLPVRHINHYCEFDGRTMARYKELEREFILDMPTGEQVEAESAAGLTNKLTQYCSGDMYDADRKVHHIHDVKIQALREIVEDNPGENIIVAYAFKPTAKKLLQEFDGAELLTDDPMQERRWSNGEIPMLVTHPASSAYGLNLQHGGSILVWFGPTWSLELYEQLNERLPRRGQKHLVRIYHIVIHGTIEEHIAIAMSGKAETQAEVMQYLEAQYQYLERG